MLDQKENSEALETWVIYMLGAVAAMIAFLLGSLISFVAVSLSRLT
ncbi:MAG: hypothetical protein ACRD8U_06870 [Pyrinomonadaceae bacterium]